MIDRYRHDALVILDRLYTRRLSFLDQEYNRCFSRYGYSARERSLLVSLLRGTIKARPHLEAIMLPCLPRWTKLPLSVQNLLRLALFQLIFHSQIPVFASVHQWVEMAKTLFQGKFTSLINAVLRRVTERIEEYRLEAQKWEVVLPEWVEEEWGFLFTREEIGEIKKSLWQPPSLTLRVNTLRIKGDDLQARLRKEGFVVKRIPVLPWALKVEGEYSDLLNVPEWEEGLFYPQDLGSQVAAFLCHPRGGERVMDLCCGVGGKAIAFAQMMEDRGEILAWDKNPQKISILQDLILRMSVKSVFPGVVDVSKFPKQYLFSADRVFLDAPCSGLGTLRKNPEIAEKITEEEVELLAEKQFELLRSASRLVKKGGIILYCVCTFTLAETVGVVRRFEEVNGEEFERVSFSVEQISPLVREWGRGNFFILPHVFHNDGFFLAIWKRK